MIAEHNLEHNFTYCSLILMLQKEIYAVSFGVRETQSVYNLVEPGGLVSANPISTGGGGTLCYSHYYKSSPPRY